MCINNFVQELLLRKTCTCLQPVTLLTLSFSVLVWNPTLPPVLKTWMRHTHACLLALLQLAVTVSF